MNNAVLATLVAAILIGASGVAFLARDAPEAHHGHAAGSDAAAGADAARMHGGMAGDMDHDGDGHPDTGMQRPAFAPAEGTVPDAVAARDLDEVHHLAIHSDEDFDPSNGVRRGNGTLADPYIIEGYYVTGDLYIADTDACFVVRENYIGGQLSLNWNGLCAHVHHNHIDDLRVNENIERTGFATGGLIELNKISFLGQLRHYDGEFRHNVVGPYVPQDIFDEVMETVPLPWTEGFRIANVDGFNQGIIHHNTFHGSVDLDLHGHHHGTGFFATHSHYHGSGEGDMGHDHTDRWTSVAFTDNLIIDPEGYGLRYDDENHAGDDRTARSEDEEQLNEDHRHHTHIKILRNTVEGAGIWIDVFNADDRNHHTRNPGWLDVVDNTVTVIEREDGPLAPLIRFGYEPRAGIYLEVAKEVDALVSGNRVTWVPLEDGNDPVGDLVGAMFSWEEASSGIRLWKVSDANVTIEGNTVEAFAFGIMAQHLDEKVAWDVRDNAFIDVQKEVWWDESVANEPST